MTRDLTRIPEFARSWAKRCLASAAGVSDEDLRNVGDWLAALAVERPHLVENPGRLVRVTWAQAMAAQRKWHADLAARSVRLAAEKKGFGGAPGDVEPFLVLEGGYRWVRVTSAEGLDYEGNAMGHCVGGGNYDAGCTILSLRDADNLPHCTVEWDEETRIVQQVQGRANQQVVERYHPMVRSLVDQLRPTQVYGAAKFGHAFAAVNGRQPRLMTWRELRDGDRIAGSLYLDGCTSLTHLPDDMSVRDDLDLRRCASLTSIPTGLKVGGYIYLEGCTSLTHLPDGLIVSGHLSLAGCTSLTHLPDGMKVGGHLYLGGCTSLTHLPDRMEVGRGLSLFSCTSLTSLPDGMKVSGNIFLPSGHLVHSLDEARAWFAERFPPETPSLCLT